MNFAGVIPEFAKMLEAETQAEPMRAEGMDKFGM